MLVVWGRNWFSTPQPRNVKNLNNSSGFRMRVCCLSGSSKGFFPWPPSRHWCTWLHALWEIVPLPMRQLSVASGNWALPPPHLYPSHYTSQFCVCFHFVFKYTKDLQPVNVWVSLYRCEVPDQMKGFCFSWVRLSRWMKASTSEVCRDLSTSWTCEPSRWLDSHHSCVGS